MKLKIEIEMDNAAFEPCNGDEAGRILRRLSEILTGEDLQDRYLQALHDINGNRVGGARVTR